MTTNHPGSTPEPSVTLEGSERQAAPGIVSGEPADPSQRIEVTVVLRRKAPFPEHPTGHLSREALAEHHGAAGEDLELATDTFTRLGAEVVEADAASRRIRLGGTVAQLSAIFGTTLEKVTSTGPHGAAVEHRHRTGSLSVPAALDGIVTAVLGLDDRPQARPQLRMLPLAAAGTSYNPNDLGRIYSFPPNTDGAGQTIAILELGGGFGQADLDAYFGGLGITPTPTVTAVGVDGATNQAGQDPQGADGEVLLDIEVIGALAPKATILVYFAPNTDAGFLDALATASHATPAPSAISISWGQSEDSWTAQARNAFDQALADATALGVTVTAAAGDRGSTDGVTDGHDHADFPASSPHALACGGTRLSADAATGAISSETVWNDSPTTSATGGGYSDVFPTPAWQNSVAGHAANAAHRKPKPKPPTPTPTPTPTTHGRGVPDVSGVADPQTGYNVRVDGQDMVIGGTSAVAPLWAALIARLAQASGKRFGLFQPVLYAQPGSFHDITVGNNGTYHAGPGWDPCTGLGSPNGAALLTALGG
ncbi:S53 family peptidase [Sinomonas sp. ASV486]|uniref:Protease pro-enzyme activation domain-containing protein n=1 Tax=Sinomonas puerhi TaxID=3238584 RepID=A0AB39L3L5_9MICC|nr:S53 family peptidase [Sinomonas sp. ASV486]MDQ4491325.1 S53 family peptidase [Sinomonas sp. ASV486]